MTDRLTDQFIDQLVWCIGSDGEHYCQSTTSLNQLWKHWTASTCLITRTSSLCQTTDIILVCVCLF